MKISGGSSAVEGPGLGKRRSSSSVVCSSIGLSSFALSRKIWAMSSVGLILGMMAGLILGFLQEAARRALALDEDTLSGVGTRSGELSFLAGFALVEQVI